jgi:hypothetical protein
MSDDPNARSKMISLRLTDAEYRALKSQFRKHGARSVSDLARLAIQQVIDAAPAGELALKVKELETRLNTMEARLASVAQADPEFWSQLSH